jgi:outer membrane protein assembly factor BamD
MPATYFFMPPSYVRDLGEAKDALSALGRFLENYPNDEKAQSAKDMKIAILDQMASHDVQVAKFYAERKKWKGAMLRYQRVIALYPNTKSAAEALYESAKISRMQLGEPGRAKNFVERILSDYPDSPFAKKAKSIL